MEVCHVESAVFDDPNVVSCAGLGPVVALAEQCGLPQLVAAQLTLPAKAGVNAHLKVPALVGAMVAGADSIADTDLLRHGGMDRLFGEVRAPSTLGTFLRAFTFGHVRQLDAVAGQLRAGDRVELTDVAEGERAQERSERARRPDLTEQPVHPAVPQQISVGDRVRAGGICQPV